MCCWRQSLCRRRLHCSWVADVGKGGPQKKLSRALNSFVQTYDMPFIILRFVFDIPLTLLRFFSLPRARNQWNPAQNAWRLVITAFQVPGIYIMQQRNLESLWSLFVGLEFEASNMIKKWGPKYYQHKGQRGPRYTQAPLKKAKPLPFFGAFAAT